MPCTPAKAQEFVESVHRHHGKVPGGYVFWALAAVSGSTVVGVAMVGRPTNRNSDDGGQTLEVLRLATDGTRNAPSMLLGACARTARAAGASRIITYTLEDEGGASLRGAGWNMEANGIKSWWTHPSGAADGRTVKPRAHYSKPKCRWAIKFREVCVLDWPAVEPEESLQVGMLFQAVEG